MLHQVELGPSLGDSYVVLSGINDGNEIVTNGTFTIDASAQLEGKRSMMNEETSRTATGHEGHNMSGGSGNMNKENEHAGHNMSSMPDNMTQKTPEKQTHMMITVQGNCEMCKDRIEKAAKSVKGVSTASWDQKSKQLHLNFDPAKTSIDAISRTIAKAGHDTGKYKADKATYDALPACCKYRNN